MFEGIVLLTCVLWAFQGKISPGCQTFRQACNHFNENPGIHKAILKCSMTSTKLLILLILSMLMVSCGQQQISGSKKKVSMSKATLEASLKKQQFDCSSLSGGACPSGIARIFIYNSDDPENSALCSGFLNGNNKIVTNNHCLSTIKECKNTYISIYNGESYENVRCESIIETKVDPGVLSQKGVDFTVMKINRSVNIKTFAVSRFTPFVGENLTAWVIDHISLTEARITELNCSYRSKSNSMLLGNCPVIHGNSGSPLVNSYDEIVGVVWGSTVDEDVDAKMDLIDRRNLNEYALVTELRHFKNYLSEK